MTREQLIEAMARAICEEDGFEPEYLEPGDALGIDGHIRGTPCHYIWRQWTTRATAALTAIEAAGLCIVPREATEGMQEMIWLASHLQNANSQYRAMIEAGRL